MNATKFFFDGRTLWKMDDDNNRQINRNNMLSMSRIPTVTESKDFKEMLEMLRKTTEKNVRALSDTFQDEDLYRDNFEDQETNFFDVFREQISMLNIKKLKRTTFYKAAPFLNRFLHGEVESDYDVTFSDRMFLSAKPTEHDQDGKLKIAAVIPMMSTIKIPLNSFKPEYRNTFDITDSDMVEFKVPLEYECTVDEDTDIPIGFMSLEKYQFGETFGDVCLGEENFTPERCLDVMTAWCHGSHRQERWRLRNYYTYHDRDKFELELSRPKGGRHR